MCTSLKKYHLEPGICSLKISNFFSVIFWSCLGFPPPSQCTIRASPQELNILPQLLRYFEKLNSYIKVSGRSTVRSE